MGGKGAEGLMLTQSFQFDIWEAEIMAPIYKRETEAQK